MPTAPVTDDDFKHSMHKTYTDCYGVPGFVGGEWAYAVNTNDAGGTSALVEYTRDQWLEEKERRLACYYLGWDSIEVCLSSVKMITATLMFYSRLTGRIQLRRCSQRRSTD